MKKLIAVTAACLLLGGCVQQPMYSWGSYEGTLYSYYKKPATQPELVESLAEVMSEEQYGNKVAPGLYAEYGFLLMGAGKTDDARRLFEKEKALWPESAVFMDVLLKSATGATATPATAPAADTPATTAAGH